MEKVNYSVSTNLEDTRSLVKISILSAIAFVIYLVEFPLPYLPPFLELDFSDIIALIGGIMLGPIAALCIELMKNILRFLLMNTGTGGIGELANFIVGIAYVIPICILFQKNRTHLKLVLSMIPGIASIVIIASLTNYAFLIPFFTGINQHAEKLSMVVRLYGPFNLIKGIVLSIVGFIIITALRKTKVLN